MLVENETDDDLQTADVTENKEAKSILMQKRNKVNPKKISHSSITSCHTNDLPNEALFSAKARQVNEIIKPKEERYLN